MAMAQPHELPLEGIVNPHDHDVLSGRGNFVNYHAGNENFRALVRKHKVAYVACPKAQKGKFSKLILDEIKALNPPGRFLKQDPKTKLWSDIGEKKSLDKTRQALREGAPELMKELSNDDDDDSVGEDQPLGSPSLGSPHRVSPSRVSHNLSQHVADPYDLRDRPQLPMLAGQNHGAGNFNSPGNLYVKSNGASGMAEAAARMSQMHRYEQNVGLESQHMHVPSSSYHLPQHSGANGSLGMMPMPQTLPSPVPQLQVPFHPGALVEQEQQLQQQLQMPPPSGPHMQGIHCNTLIFPANNNNVQVKVKTMKSSSPFLSVFDPRPIGSQTQTHMNFRTQSEESLGESAEYVAPLPPPRKVGIKSRRGDLLRENSEHSLQCDNIFAGIKTRETVSMSGANTGGMLTSSTHGKNQSSLNHNMSAMSGMSLSIGDMGVSNIDTSSSHGDGFVSSADSSSPVPYSLSVDPLSTRFNNSLSIGGQRRLTNKGGRRLDGSSRYYGSEGDTSGVPAGTMDMSVATLGEYSVASHENNMSFSNVFEETDRDIYTNTVVGLEKTRAF